MFISRHDFTPRYTKNSTLENPFWSISEMDEFRLPNQEEKVGYNSLITGLISWITAYEENIIDCLGMDYRRASLIKWDNGERVVIACEEIINEWENLSRAILNESPF